LAREAEIALADDGMITDYDCWKVGKNRLGETPSLAICFATPKRQKKALERVVPEIRAEAIGRSITL